MDAHDTLATRLDGHLRTGARALPVFGALLVVGSLTHQPDFTTDFPAYAAYVTSEVFLASHLVASILGAGIGVIGTASVALLVASRTRHGGRALLGAAVSTVAHVLNTALFGVAAFAQPAIGRAYRDGSSDAVALNSDVYGPELVTTAGAALVLWTVGAVLLGTALRRTSQALRGPGLAYAVTLPVFFVSGLLGGPVQPLAAAAFTAAAVLVVRRLTSTVAPEPTSVPA
jgi:hypothetical protein